MARIDVPQLTTQAAAEVLYRGNQLRRDPAWLKSAKLFSDDVAQAVRSGGDFAQETRSAWRRSARVSTTAKER